MKVQKTQIVVPVRIVLVAPTPGVDFGIQEGKGNDYKTITIQRAKTGKNIQLDFAIKVSGDREDETPNLVGPIAQGPRANRFLYVDVGKYAGQNDSCWQRRIKIPLQGISWKMIDEIVQNPKRLLLATIPGTGKDGGPSCATVKPIDGWQVAS